MKIDYGPLVRIALRYVLGGGAYAAMADDRDVVAIGCVAVAAVVEAVYTYAKKKGWAT